MRQVTIAVIGAMAVFGLGCGVLAGAVHAQSYPARPVRMVVPFPAGGATDTTARTVAERLSVALGQPIIIDNRPGAGGTIGSDVVAKAAPDGYTLLTSTTSTHSIGPVLNPKIPYNVERDFAPVAYVATAPTMLIVNMSVPVRTVAELIAYARARPGQLTFASSGTGTSPHLSGEYFRSLARLDMVHIPYKGTQLAMPDLISGQVTMMFDVVSTALPHVRSGKARALAVGSAKRSSLVPDVPTVAESGLTGYVSDVYFGVFAPANTPREIVDRLAGEINRIVQLTEVRERFASLGAEPVGGTPQQFAQVIRAETAKWTAVIRDAGIKLE